MAHALANTQLTSLSLSVEILYHKKWRIGIPKRYGSIYVTERVKLGWIIVANLFYRTHTIVLVGIRSFGEAYSIDCVAKILAKSNM